MNMIYGLLCLIAAVAIFVRCLPRAVKDSGLQRTTRLKKDVDSSKCRH